MWSPCEDTECDPGRALRRFCCRSWPWQRASTTWQQSCCALWCRPPTAITSLPPFLKPMASAASLARLRLQPPPLPGSGTHLYSCNASARKPGQLICLSGLQPLQRCFASSECILCRMRAGCAHGSGAVRIMIRQQACQSPNVGAEPLIILSLQLMAQIHVFICYSYGSCFLF